MFTNWIQATFVATETALYEQAMDCQVRRQANGRYAYHPCVANKPPKLLHMYARRG